VPNETSVATLARESGSNSLPKCRMKTREFEKLPAGYLPSQRESMITPSRSLAAALKWRIHARIYNSYSFERVYKSRFKRSLLG